MGLGLSGEAVIISINLCAFSINSSSSFFAASSSSPPPSCRVCD
uniref:Uncharacterized protein n=1 Tax=Rhizophora mucronata TaxID=61149 RepID=A0A2P2IM47_RHIMU